jgi:anti-sigma factor RsiW
MTCAECEPLIGLFADGELDPQRADAVASHLANCPACAANLAAIRELGNAVRQLSVPAVPADLWDRIASQISRPAAAGTIRSWRDSTGLRYAMVAVLLAAAVVANWLAFWPAAQDAPPAPRLELAALLEKGTPIDAAGCQFHFAAVPLEEVKHKVTFRIFDQPELTEGCTAEQCRVGSFAGTMVVETVYRRGEDRWVLLQYPRHIPAAFGKAPAEEVPMGEKSVTVVEGETHWAVSWQFKGTALTIVGPRDRAELLRIAAEVEQSLAKNFPCGEKPPLCK